ncbi:MAG: SPOR domain-containing protein [Bacteroidota bacterium]
MAFDPVPWRNKGPETIALVCLVVFGGYALPGCSSPEQTGQETATDATTEGREVRFEVRTDTVEVLKPDDSVVATAAASEPEIRFAVQIGAFRDPENARSVGDAARGRFSFPVTNNYDAESGLHLVRVGTFETRDAAHEIRVKMQKGYPKDYRDCWIVQVKEDQ